MISKRHRRYSEPQERLRQFALNNSKGIDETNPITDSDSVLYTENLKTNLDGSLSLRDPLNVVASLPDCVRSIPIFDDAYIIFTSSGSFGICWDKYAEVSDKYELSDSNNSALLHIRYRKTSGNEDTFSIPSNDGSLTNWFNVSNAEIVRTNTSIVLGNCSVNVPMFNGLVDAELYDSVSWLPRYLKISFEGTEPKKVFVDIVSPEPNEISSTDGAAAIALNTTLDNPYSVRDTYHSGYTDVKGILPYAYTDADLNPTVLSDVGAVKVKEITESLKPDRFRIASVVDPSHTGDVTTVLKAVGTFPEPILAESPNFTWEVDDPDALIISPQSDSSRCTVYAKKVGTFGVTAKYESWTATCEVVTDYDIKRMLFYDNPNSDTPLTNVRGGEYEAYFYIRFFDVDGGELIGNLLPNVSSLSWVKPSDSKLNLSFSKDSSYGKEYIRCRVTRNSNESIAQTATITYTFKNNTVFESDIPISFLKSPDTPLPEPVSLATPVTQNATAVTELSKAYSARSIATGITTSPQTVYLNVAVNPYRYGAFVKASLKNPNVLSQVYATWMRGNVDGTYTPVLKNVENSVKVRELVETVEIGSDEDGSGTAKALYHTVEYLPISVFDGSDDLASKRVDVLFTNGDLKTPYKFKIITTRTINESDPEAEPGGGSQLAVGVVLDVAVYTPNLGDDWEFAEYTSGNSVNGKKLFYKAALYSYGDPEFQNAVFKSDAGSFITPYINGIFADSVGHSKITAVVPWRDYLYVATESSALLAIPQEHGFYTKIVNTFIGIPEADSKCCKVALNGIVFKAGHKIYIGYPNAYSDSDTVLNYTEISKPIESRLEDILNTIDSLNFFNKRFECYAVTSSSEYVLFILWRRHAIKDIDTTYTFRYKFNTKCWEINTYSVLLEDAYVYRDGAIHAFYSKDNIRYETTLEGTYNMLDIGSNEPGKIVADGRYVDILYDIRDTDTDRSSYQPIRFKWDTGQKTDAIANTKQFVESKLIFATLDEKDTFPFTLHIAVDGDPHVTKMDVSTDAPFWKSTDGDSTGVLNTSFSLGIDSPVSDTFNTLRQLVVRYSGKGKSVRHLIEGESFHNFKLYETYVRYKNLNVK